MRKSNEYHAGNMIGADSESELYRGNLVFMIVGLKKSIPYVIKSCPVVSINIAIVKTEILESLATLKAADFRVFKIVSDNHSTNVSAYSSLIKD